MTTKPVRKDPGLTLIEMMIVIALLGMLAVVIGSAVTGHFNRAKASITKTQLKTLREQIEIYHVNEQHYPKQEEGLKVLTQAPSSGGLPYINEDQLKDAWGNEILYSIPGPTGKPFDLISLGDDGKRGGDGLAKDLSVWDVEEKK